MELEVQQEEASVGPFRADILSIDSRDESQHPRLHAWLLEKMVAFERVFRPRVKSLDDAPLPGSSP